MSEFTEQQIPEIARRVLAERDAGRSVDPQRIVDRRFAPDGPVSRVVDSADCREWVRAAV